MIFVDASLEVPAREQAHVRSGQVARVFVVESAGHASR
jgi:hypothetical protein